MKIYFVDDRPGEIITLWEKSGCSFSHLLLPVESFQSIERCMEAITKYQPDIIAVGYGLGAAKPNGVDVIRRLRANGYRGHIVGNSGGGGFQFKQSGIDLDADVSRDPQKLAQALSSPATEEQK